ncbi:MAG TPA: carboxypeptidase regulatory-like domain-containing protein [Gemmatimonadaceae bacterium]|nr:carboxypeptidase regulatory-like domain-containing protein [Gemmatimonadaceae bacterium]
MRRQLVRIVVAILSRFARPSITVAMVLALPAVAPTAGAQIQVQSQTPDSSAAPGTITLTGTVRDASGRPTVGAEARVDQRRAALTDTTGRFLLRNVPFGPVELVVRRIGYERATLELAPEQPGLRIELAVRLTESSVTLPSVLVEGKAYDQGLWEVGFYKRQRVGSGTYFDPDFLQHYGGASVATLVREVPRIYVERYNNQEYAYGRVAGAPCRMNIYVDGFFRRDAMPGSNGDKGTGLDVLLPKDEIYAVEVYPSVNFVPSEFTRMGPKAGRQLSTPRIPLPGAHPLQDSRWSVDEVTNNDAACGAVVIWTRHGMALRAGSDSARTP